MKFASIELPRDPFDLYVNISKLWWFKFENIQNKLVR